MIPNMNYILISVVSCTIPKLGDAVKYSIFRSSRMLSNQLGGSISYRVTTPKCQLSGIKDEFLNNTFRAYNSIQTMTRKDMVRGTYIDGRKFIRTKLHHHQQLVYKKKCLNSIILVTVFL